MIPRRTVCALALPAFPLVLLAATLVTPTDSTENAVQLRAAAAHGATWAAAAALELLAAAVIPFAVVGVVQAVRDRGRALANAGGILGVLGTLGMASIAFRHVSIYGLAIVERAQALRVLDRVDHVFGPIALPLMFCAAISWIVLAAAAVRAQVAPRWVPVGAFVFFVSDMLPIPGAEVVQSVVGLVTFAVLAHAIITERRPQRRAARAPVAAEA
jgi:hypothetical protein